MSEIKYYYDFGEINKELKSFDDLNIQFEAFKKAYEEKNTDVFAPVLNVTAEPSINGVEFLSATYFLRKGLFSKKIKTDEFGIQAKKIEEDGTTKFYMWYTKNIEELKSIYYEFVVNQRTPNFDNWIENFVMSD